MGIFLGINRRNVVDFNIEILVDGNQSSGKLNIVFHLDDDLLPNQGLEEGIEEHPVSSSVRAVFLPSRWLWLHTHPSPALRICMVLQSTMLRDRQHWENRSSGRCGAEQEVLRLDAARVILGGRYGWRQCHTVTLSADSYQTLLWTVLQ